ncbi:MAG: alpha-2-macroglobulin, partial [Pedobacter sp.]
MVVNEVLLQGKVAGLNTVEDTKVYEFAAIDHFDIKTGNYIVNGKKLKNLSKVSTRTNFNETAFFFPQLRTDQNGEITIEFKIPESLTRFKMLGFAHTKDLRNTVVSKELITQKQFAISANTPRYFREGDTIRLNAKLNNLSGKKLKGHAALQVHDALTGKPINLLMLGRGANEMQKFALADNGGVVLQWPLVIPAGLSAVTYKVVAESGKYSDGEEMTIPVLPNSMLVTETMAINIRGNSTKTFNMDKLLQSRKSSSIRSQSYTLEFTSNPAWYAIQSLPYLMEYPFECAEQTFSRFYANSFASQIINSSPKIGEVFKQWKELDGGNALLSNLEKNQQLKSVLLEETPWIANAANESDRKKRLGVLFDLNRMSSELKRNFDKLEQMQKPNGAFPWFTG